MGMKFSPEVEGLNAERLAEALANGKTGRIVDVYFLILFQCCTTKAEHNDCVQYGFLADVINHLFLWFLCQLVLKVGNSPFVITYFALLRLYLALPFIQLVV